MWLIHDGVWQRLIQYYKAIVLKKKKKQKNPKQTIHLNLHFYIHLHLVLFLPLPLLQFPLQAATSTMPPWELEYSENVELFPIKAKHKDYHKFVHTNMSSLFQLNIYCFKFHTME